MGATRPGGALLCDHRVRNDAGLSSAGANGSRLSPDRSDRCRQDHHTDGTRPDHRRSDRGRPRRRQGSAERRGQAARSGQLRASARSAGRRRVGLLVHPRRRRRPRGQAIRGRSAVAREQGHAREEDAGVLSPRRRQSAGGPGDRRRSAGARRDGGSRQRHDLQRAEPAARADADRPVEQARDAGDAIARHGRRGRSVGAQQHRRNDGRLPATPTTRERACRRPTR